MAVKAGLAIQGYALLQEEQQKTTNSFIGSPSFTPTPGSIKSQLTMINPQITLISQLLLPISMIINWERLLTLPLNSQQANQTLLSLRHGGLGSAQELNSQI